MKTKLMGIGRCDGATVLAFCTIASRRNQLDAACVQLATIANSRPMPQFIGKEAARDFLFALMVRFEN
jgi:hypothetical protein